MYQRLKLFLLGWWSRLITRWAAAVLVIAGVLAVGSVYLTLVGANLPGLGQVGPLGFQSNRNDLISPKLEWNQRFINWQKGFPGTWDLIVVVDAGPDGPERKANARAAEKLVDELGRTLKAGQWVRDCVWGFDTSTVSPKAVRLETLDESKPSDEFRSWLKELRGASVLAGSASPEAFLKRTLDELKAQDQDNAPDSEARAISGLRSFAGVLTGFTQSLDGPADKPVDFDKLVRGNMPADWAYLVSDNGRLYFLRVTPKHAPNQINALEPAITEVRRIMAKIAPQHPRVTLGLTGIDVVEADETAVVDWDSTWTGVLTGALMFLLLVAAFHSWRTPLMIMLALAAAIAWTFGFTTLVIGHIQVISIVFIPLLLGLGIAYGIYIAARFEMIRHQYPDTRDGYTQAMVDVFQTMGPGIITGCVTTAAAFVMTLFTDFTGVAEMGLIAAVGIVLCLVSMGTVFPALVRLIKPAHKDVKPLEARWFHFYEDRWFMPFARHPRATLVVAGVFTLASLVSLLWMRFDYNLLKLQAEGMDSVRWERKIVEDGGESIWFGVSIVGNMEQARSLARQYRAQPTVGLVRGVGLLVPPDDARKIELLKQVDAELKQAQIQADGPQPPMDLRQQVQALNLAFGVQSLRSDIPPAVRPAIQEVGRAISDLNDALTEIPPAQQAARLAKLRTDFTHWRTLTLARVAQALDTSPLGLNDLPEAILKPYRGTIDGREVLALEIFAASHDAKTGQTVNALDPKFLGRFVKDLRAVDPKVTGVIVQVYESGTLIQKSYVFAGVLGLIVVFLLVIFDFGSWRDALLSLLPVVIGFAVTFGIMRLFGQMVNPANIVVLPLMFGIGVDSGVHMIYRWRMDRTGQPPGLSQGTGKGIVIVNLATLIGFGVMMLASHRGIQSLGFVLTIGMGMTLLACLTVMPAWLELRNRRGA